MKWFKHDSNCATQDPKIIHLIDEYGMEGYGRYNVLVEHLVAQSETLESTPKAEHSIRIWAKILHLKQKNVENFLEYLQDISIIKMECLEGEISVALLNHSKMLTNSAISSAKRPRAGEPVDALEESRREKTKKDQRKLSSSQENNQGNKSSIGSKERKPSTGSQSPESTSPKSILSPIDHQESTEMLKLVSAL